MKIKTNVRAGSGGTSANSNKPAGATDSSRATTPMVFYVPPASRCVGI